MAKTAKITVKITATVDAAAYALAYGMDPCDTEELADDIASYIGNTFDDDTATGTITGFTWKRLTGPRNPAGAKLVTVVVKIKGIADINAYADTYGTFIGDVSDHAAAYIGNTFSREGDALGSGSFTDITWTRQAR